MIEPGQLLAHGLLQRPRQLRSEEVRHDRPRSDDPHQLLDDERDAAAAPVQRFDDRRRRLAVGGGGDGADHRRLTSDATQALQPDLLDGVPAFQPQHELATRLSAREVVGTVRRDDHEVRPRLLGDAVDQVGTGGVDPVEILDDEHGRTATRGVGDGVSTRRRPGRHRSRRRRPSATTASSGRPIDPGCADVPSVATPGGSDASSSPHEPGLADARFARDERHGRLIARSSPGPLRRGRRGARRRPTGRPSPGSSRLGRAAQTRT